MLDLFNFTPIVIIILSIFQTIIGVGILVLGTPILLLIGLEMIEVMKILLPLSILNSSLNILYFKLKHKLIEIDNLMKTKVYDNKQSKKISEVIEESYRSRFNEFLLDDKMMPIHEDVAIKISNLINECSTGEIKEFIPFEKVDNFFNYKNEVFNNYYMWRKELIRFNKRKEIKYQV